jgi:hypothetical protein
MLSLLICQVSLLDSSAELTDMNTFKLLQSPTIPIPTRPKFRLSRFFWTGLGLLILGTGPLLGVILLARVGITEDPNPNPDRRWNIGLSDLLAERHFDDDWHSDILCSLQVRPTNHPANLYRQASRNFTNRARRIRTELNRKP